MPILVCLTAQKTLMPLTAADRESVDQHKVGQQFELKALARNQNGKLHRKLFSLLNFGYQFFEPKTVMHPDFGEIQPIKNFDAYRAWALIAAGYFDWVATPKGVRPTAKSLKYSRMSPVEREQVYSAVAQVIYSQLCEQQIYMRESDFYNALREFERYE